MKPLLLMICLLALSACQNEATAVEPKVLEAIAQRVLIVDVRTPEEFRSGHFPGAINIPHEQIIFGLGERQVRPSDPVVLYCRSGNRSGKAQAALRSIGFSQTLNAGGLAALLTATGLKSAHPDP